MHTITMPVLQASINQSTGETEHSAFSNTEYSVDDYNGLFITERMTALNFRHRMSEPGYTSSWHMAGDPTLIIIRSGTLRIRLRNGDYRDFMAGDMFIAQDHLQVNEIFDDQIHGHMAELMGDQILHAVHIKLGSIEK